MASWCGGENAYTAAGEQTTGAIAPFPTPGSWLSVTFLSDKTLTKIRIRHGGSSDPRDFVVFRLENTTWINTGFSVSLASQPPADVYEDYTIPAVNGGGASNWRGIAIVVSKIGSPDVNNTINIRELDFQ